MKIAIIGGGYSGIIASYELSKDKNKEIYIFESGYKLGRKLLATGNGKANIGNLNLKSDFYSNKELYEEVILNKEFDIREYFLKEFNMLTRIDKEELIYPYSLSSKTVLDCILNKIEKKENIKILLNKKVNSIIVNKNSKFLINNEFEFDKVIIATGGKSYQELGSDGSIFPILKSLGEEITNFRPSLVGFKAKTNDLEGLRVKGTIKLEIDNKIIKEEKGEIQFKKNGISGICALNLSFYFPDTYKEAYLIIDPLDEYNDYSWITDLKGVFHEKLVNYLKKNKIKDLKNIKFKIEGLLDYKEAQVTRGGVNYLISKKNKGLYFIGEVVNMDGICGGYNLLWALYSAIYITKSI